MNKQLAKITAARLNLKDKGILNFWIFVDYEDGGCQGIGGLALDAYDGERGRRIGTAYGCEMIRRVLDVLDVDDFSEMEGKIIWVHGEGSGLSFKPKGIELLRVAGAGKEPLFFDEIYEEFVKLNNN